MLRIKMTRDYTQRQNLGALANAEDFFYFYNASKVDFETIRNGGLIPVNRFPAHERLFCADMPINQKIFTLDHAGRYWIFDSPEIDKVRNPEGSGKRAEMMYKIGKELGLSMTETRVATIDRVDGIFDGKTYRNVKAVVSRFLANAMDGGFIEQVPEGLQAKVKSQLDAFWPFNFLVGFNGDTQYIFTPNGNVLLMDYFPGLLFNPELIPIPEEVGVNWSDSLKWDVGLQKNELWLSQLPYSGKVNRAEIDRMVNAIEGLSDGFLEQVVQGLPETYERYGHVIDYPEEVIKGLQWRRDNVRKVFSL